MKTDASKNLHLIIFLIQLVNLLVITNEKCLIFLKLIHYITIQYPTYLSKNTCTVLTNQSHDFTLIRLATQR